MPDDVVTVVFDRDRVEAFPPRLLYYPVTMPGPEAPADAFSAGEDLENFLPR